MGRHDEFFNDFLHQILPSNPLESRGVTAPTPLPFTVPANSRKNRRCRRVGKSRTVGRQSRTSVRTRTGEHCSIANRIRAFYPRRTSGIPGIAGAIGGAAQEDDRETIGNITFEPDVKTMTIILIPILFLTTWLFLLGVGLLLDAGRRVVMESRWRSTSG